MKIGTETNKILIEIINEFMTLTLTNIFTDFFYTTNIPETNTENTQLKLSPGEQLVALWLSAILRQK